MVKRGAVEQQRGRKQGGILAVGHHDYGTIPAETAQLVRATFKRGNKYVVLRDGLAAVRQLNRPELVGERLRAALDEVAMLAPAAWYVRYGQRIEAYQLPKTPTALQAWLVQVGADGQRLLAAVDQPATPPATPRAQIDAVAHRLPAIARTAVRWRPDQREQLAHDGGRQVEAGIVAHAFLDSRRCCGAAGAGGASSTCDVCSPRSGGRRGPGRSCAVSS